jgi:hypothetical protein
VIALGTKLKGDVTERSAGEYEASYALQNPIAACMSQAGYDYVWWLSDSYRGFDVNPSALGGQTDWLAQLDTRFVSDNATQLAQVHSDMRNGEAQLRAYANAHPGFVDQLGKCDADAGRPGESSPTAHANVGVEYSQILSSVDASLDSHLGAYQSCMDTRGFTVRDYPQLISHLQSRVPSESEIPVDGQPAGDQWSKFLRLEADAMTADAHCRKPEHLTAMRQLASKLDAFQTRHADGIAAVQSDWQRIVDSATGHGWHPPA